MITGINSIRILIADEQPVFRHSLRKLLECERGVQVVGEASDAAAAGRMRRQLRPDLMLVDLALVKQLDSQPEDARSDLAARTIVMLAAIEKYHVVEAFQFGAHGILLKNSPPRLWLKGIRSVMAGNYWLENQSVAVLVEALRDSLVQGSAPASPKDYGLTARELDIIAKIVNGHSNKEVGEEFSICERTVKHHLTNIFNKVGVSSRLELALFAVNRRLLRGPTEVQPAPIVEEECESTPQPVPSVAGVL